MKQVSTAAALVHGGHPVLTDIPENLPLRGIVVTSEPHHLINSPVYRQRLTKATIPTVILSLGTLEGAVSYALAGDATDVFLQLSSFRQERGLDVERVMNQWLRDTGASQRLSNPILDAGWERLERATGVAHP